MVSTSASILILLSLSTYVLATESYVNKKEMLDGHLLHFNPRLGKRTQPDEESINKLLHLLKEEEENYDNNKEMLSGHEIHFIPRLGKRTQTDVESLNKLSHLIREEGLEDYYQPKGRRVESDPTSRLSAFLRRPGQTPKQAFDAFRAYNTMEE